MLVRFCPIKYHRHTAELLAKVEAELRALQAELVIKCFMIGTMISAPAKSDSWYECSAADDDNNDEDDDEDDNAVTLITVVMHVAILFFCYYCYYYYSSCCCCCYCPCYCSCCC